MVLFFVEQSTGSDLLLCLKLAIPIIYTMQGLKLGGPVKNDYTHSYKINVQACMQLSEIICGLHNHRWPMYTLCITCDFITVCGNLFHCSMVK